MTCLQPEDERAARASANARAGLRSYFCSPSHGENRGSSPLGSASNINDLASSSSIGVPSVSCSTCYPAPSTLSSALCGVADCGGLARSTVNHGEKLGAGRSIEHQTTNLGVRSSKSLRARQLNQKLRMILPIDPGAIRLSRVHNQVHDRAASARGLVSNGSTQLAA